MKKKFMSILLSTILLSTNCWTGVLAASGKYNINTIDPLYSAENLSLSTTPVAVTNDAVSNFTVDADYTVKSGETASVTFDMEDTDWKNVYYSDFSNPEDVWDSTTEFNSRINSKTERLLFKSTVSNTIKYGNAIVDNIDDFDLEFDVKGLADYARAGFNFRGGQYNLYILGELSAASSKYQCDVYIYYRGSGGKIVAKYDNPDYSSLLNKRVRLLSFDDTIQVFVNGEKVIDYACPEGDVEKTLGPIKPCATDSEMSIDNMSINARRESSYWPEIDSYYQVDLGENVTIGSRIDGSYTEIAKSDITLTPDQKYNFVITRKDGNIVVSADGDEVLNANIDFSSDAALWNGLIGFVASKDDVLENVAVYDSTNIQINDGFAEILPINNAVKDEFEIVQGTWSTGKDYNNDSAHEIVSDNEFWVKTDTLTNTHVTVNNILNNNYSDVYISFDVKGNRDVHTRDRFTFAGYVILFISNDAGTVINPTVKSPSGATITPDYTYPHFLNNTYTFELIKKGPTVSVYYYPKGEERNLFFTDNTCEDTAVNFSFYRLNGRIDFTNFTVFDAQPSAVKNLIALNENSSYVKTSDGIGAIPMGTTVREVKANLINGSVAKITRDGSLLSDSDIVCLGDIIECADFDFIKWKIGTLGDLSGDGVIDNSDLELAQTVNGDTTAQTAAMAGADINQDGVIDQEDYDIYSEMIENGTSNMTYIKRSIVGDALLIHGKNIGRQFHEENLGVNFEWTAANITIGGYMQGDVTVTINYDSGEARLDSGIDVYLDGNDNAPDYIQLNSGVGTYTIAKDLEAGYHTIKIMKNNTSALGAFYMEAIDLTGTLSPVAEKKYAIEFLGDSITSGCGVLNSTAFGDYEGYHFNHYSYASVTARILDADYYCLSNSGWGFAKNLKNPYTINRIYDLASDRRGEDVPYDFSWKSDLVVINLGTNDNTVLYNKVNEASENGTTFDYAAAKTSYKEEVVDMLNRVRKYNADAKIIWTYGAMGYGIKDPNGEYTGDWIKEAIEEYNSTDGKVVFYRMTESRGGGGSHPEYNGSYHIGYEFSEFIADYMGWEIPETNYGDVVAEYDFDTTTEGVVARDASYVSCQDGALRFDTTTNHTSFSSVFTNNKYLDTYEMNLTWKHSGNVEYNRMALLLRSPNSDLEDAIYLAISGSKIAGDIGNGYNALKEETNVQLVAVKDGVVTKLDSKQMDDILDKQNKNINVKMGVDWLEITIWNVGTEKPVEPTFAVEINNKIAPAFGDVLVHSRNSTDVFDDINIVYGVNVDLPGDLNKSTELDAMDLVLMRHCLLGNKDYIENIDHFAKDVNLDSKVDASDIVRLKKLIANLTES